MLLIKMIIHYGRIVSEMERAQIISSGKIPRCHKDWTIYLPGSVVFLWDMCEADPALIHDVAILNAQTYGEKMWLLEFEAEIQTEPDRSGPSWLKAVVSHVDIDLASARNVRWGRFRNRQPVRPFSP
jgi:hypothetical protein